MKGDEMEGGERQGEAGLGVRPCKVLTGLDRQGRAGQHRVGEEGVMQWEGE